MDVETVDTPKGTGGGEEPGGTDTGTRPGSKPQLRVYIPGQKEFVPRTVRLHVIVIFNHSMLILLGSNHTISIMSFMCIQYP